MGTATTPMAIQESPDGELVNRLEHVSDEQE